MDGLFDGGARQSFESALARLVELEREVARLRRDLLAQVLLNPAQPPPSRDEPEARSETETPARRARRWVVTFLGRFSLACDGAVVPPCSSRRGQSILHFLLSRPDFAALPDELIDCFWPGADSSAGAHNLQMAISVLRRTLRDFGPGGDEAVVYGRGRYRLNPAIAIELDVDAFRTAFERGEECARAAEHAEALRAFEAARACYGGDYLADSPYEAWVAGRRASLQRMYLTVLSRLGDYYLQARDWDGAAGCCRDLLEADPYREDAYRQLMRCHAASGRMADVQRTYRACRERLREDLRIAPSASTAALHRRLLLQGGR